MLITRNPNHITIQRSVDSLNYVRIGVLKTALYIDDVRRCIRDNVKPHDSITICDCTALLEELERVERLSNCN